MPESREVPLTPEQLYGALERNAGNKTAMARELGVHRDTVRKFMDIYGIGNKPVTGGYIKPQAINKRDLPSEGVIFRYILTSAQNNTKVFKAFLENLIAYKDYHSHSGLAFCELMISRFTYNKGAYENGQNHPSKAGRGPNDSDHGDLWYDPAIEPYVCDDPDRHGSCRYQLAPDLQWCAESNILPTAENPLSGLDAYAGTASAIFPHAKVMLRSVPRMPSDLPRFIYTTGCVTQMNYIQRKAGQKAEFHHIYGAIIVEVNSKGDWWARQINAASDGSFYDCAEGQVVKVVDGVVKPLAQEKHCCEAINWGDVHLSEIDEQVATVNWGVVDLDNESSLDGAIDSLRPKYQLLHDTFSMRSQTHHDRNKFAFRYEKFVKGQDNVFKELTDTAIGLNRAYRPWCKSAIINSNHDRHGDRWLDEADYKADLPNAELFLRAQLSRVLAIKENKPWTFFGWALKRMHGREPLQPVQIVDLDESFLIGPRGHQVECGLHGDLGPNGSRGSNKSLTKLGRRNNKGHDHSAGIYEGTYSAGTCQLKFRYNVGPTTWSVSHIITYLNGKRALLTQRAGRLWA